MQPSLALVYSSRGGDGYFGNGWSLTGSSSIHRCAKTWAQDGLNRDVRNDAQDRFCLDGNQLKLTSGTYGSAGSTYQTEVETFSRVTAYGTAGNGPAYFIVEGKDGLYYEYGNTTDSRIESVGQSTARTWALDKVSDRAGNAMLYGYTEDTTNGSYRLASIQYTQNTGAGVSAGYSVELSYDPIPTGEVDAKYFAGSLVNRITRASHIDVKSGGTVVRRYTLTYETLLSPTSKSRLSTVQECGLTLTDCLAPTTFTYQNSTAGVGSEVSTGSSVPANVNPWPIDVNGDGRKDLVYPSSVTSGSGTWMVMFANSSGGYNTPVNTGITNTNWSGATPIDYNADGLEDLLVPYSGGTWWVMLGTSSGLATPINTSIATTATGTGTNARGLDIDGDGYQDLVWADLVGYAGGDTIKYRLRVPGGTFSSTATTLVGPLPADEMITSGVFAPAGQRMPTHAPDFNGDGREDIAYLDTIRQSNQLIAGGAGTSSITYTYFRFVRVICPGGTNFGASVDAPTVPYFGDFNGDGRTDLLYTSSAPFYPWKLRYSTGTSFTSEIVGPNSTNYGGTGYVVLDWDGDGYDDLLLPRTSTGHWDFVRSTGSGFATASDTGLPYVTTDITVTDIDGDGLQEIGYNASGIWKYRLHAGVEGDLLLTATDGFGMSATFAYVPITQNNYTKYATATFPDQDYQGPLYVVSTLTASTGISSPATYTQDFWYYGMRLNLQGRGSEGFDARRSKDNRNNLYAYQYFRRDFPYVGMVYQDDLKQSDNSTLIHRVQNTPSALTGGTGFETRKFPYVSSSSSDSYEFGGTRNGAWLAHGTMTVNTIDTYGNVTQTTSTIQDKDSLSPWTAETYTTVSTATITNYPTTWCLGRPTQTTVQSTLPDTTSQTRTQGATIDSTACRATQSVIEPASSTLKVTTNYGFDSAGNINSVQVIGKKPDGTDIPVRTTTMDYGTRKQFPETVTNALTQPTLIGYFYDRGLQQQVTDPNGLITSWLYDDYGRKTRETRPDLTYTGWSLIACTSGNSYCSLGLTDLRTEVTATQYTTGDSAIRANNAYLDAFDRGRVNDSQNLSGGFTHVVTTYDSLGRQANVSAPYSVTGNGSRQWTYDGINRVTADGLYTSGGSLDRQTTFDYLGRYVSITDPKSAVTQRYVDVRGLLRRLVDPSPGGTTNYAFTPFGDLSQVTDAASNAQSWTYDLRGFVTASSDPDRGSWTYSVNSLGEPVSQTDAKSQTVTYGAFDALGRPTTRTEAEGTSTWTWGSSAASKNIGKLQSVAGPGYSESYTFDSLGRSSTTTISADVTYQIDYAYSATTGFLDSVTYPTSTSGYRLKAQYLYQYGIPNQVRDFNVPATVWWQLNAMDDRGSPVDEQLGNGVHILANNDGLTGHLNWRTSGNSSPYTNQQNLTYNWDKNESLKDRIDVNQSNLTEHFEYDALNRLDYSTRNGVTNLDIALDAIGNITSKTSATDPAENIGTYTYHATKKHAVVSTSNGWTFTYDGNGNMQTGRGATITWTSYDLPASISNGTISSTFSYKPDRGYWKQIANYSGGSETTVYVGGLLEKVTSAGGIDYRHMIHAGSATIVVTRSTGTNNDTYYLTQDNLGSSTAVTNGAGALVVNESFAAYGARRGSNWTGTPTSGNWTAIANSTRRGYTQHTMLDNLNLIQMNGRMYDPALGRFVSADPMLDLNLGAQGLNRYAYVGNKSLTLIDPTGLDSQDDGMAHRTPVDPQANIWAITTDFGMDPGFSCSGNCGPNAQNGGANADGTIRRDSGWVFSATRSELKPGGQGRVQSDFPTGWYDWVAWDTNPKDPFIIPTFVPSWQQPRIDHGRSGNHPESSHEVTPTAPWQPSVADDNSTCGFGVAPEDCRASDGPLAGLGDALRSKFGSRPIGSAVLQTIGFGAVTAIPVAGAVRYGPIMYAGIKSLSPQATLFILGIGGQSIDDLSIAAGTVSLEELQRDQALEWVYEQATEALVGIAGH